MNPRHLNSDQIIETVYGLGEPFAVDHLEHCVECQRQASAIETLRRAGTQTLEPSTERLATQRIAVRERATHPSLEWRRPAFAAGLLAAGLAAVAFFPRDPGTVGKMAPAVEDDADLASLISPEWSAETQAVAPLRGLFESAEVPAEER